MIIEEIRIYYESPENAEYFVKPVIQEILKNQKLEVPIKIIQLYKSRNNKNPSYSFYSKSVAPIIYRKNPDILVTIVQEKKESPLCLIELSASVYTEDHELQRFDALDTALQNNCIGIKISSFRKSRSGHGGNAKYDHHEMYAILFKKYSKCAFFLEWPTTNDDFAVITDGVYLSNPPKMQHLYDILLTCFKEIVQNNYTQNFAQNVEKNLQKIEFFKNWTDAIKKFNLESPSSLNSNRTKWFDNHPDIHKSALEIKVNRMGHEMNPENGMINKYGSQGIIQTTRFVFDDMVDQWYTGSSNVKKIKDFVDTTKLKHAYDFLHSFLLGTNLIKLEEFKKLDRTFQGSTDSLIDVNLEKSDFKNFNQMRKELRLIFSFSELIRIQDKNMKTRVILRWDKSKMNTLNSDNLPNITPIGDKQMGESEVTFIAAHMVFREKLGGKIIHISYPGDLGTPFLPEPEQGRTQKRIYFDILAKTKNNNVLICESKGCDFKGVCEDIEKLSITKKCLKTLQEKFLSVHFNIKSTCIVEIGVAFIEPEKFSVDEFKKQNLKKLDYFIMIDNTQKHFLYYSKTNDKWNEEIKEPFILPQRFEIVRKKQ